MSNSELTTFSEGEVLSMAEAAREFGVTVQALQTYIRKNDLKDPRAIWKQFYTCSVSGKSRRMTVILKEALIVLGFHKGAPASNQYEKKHAAYNLPTIPIEALPEGKEELRLMAHEMAQDMVDDLTYAKITAEQKKILDDLCKVKIFKRMGVVVGNDYNFNTYQRMIMQLRMDMNAYMGRRKIDNYTHLDYIRAEKWLKKQ